jgi:hypothetical protein
MTVATIAGVDAIHARGWHMLALLAALAGCHDSPNAYHPSVPPPGGDGTPELFYECPMFSVGNLRCDDVTVTFRLCGGDEVSVSLPPLGEKLLSNPAPALGCPSPPPSSPSAALCGLRVTSGDQVVYEGVHDADWKHGVLIIPGPGAKCFDAKPEPGDAGIDIDAGDEHDAGTEPH